MAWYSGVDSVLRRWNALSERPLPDDGFAGFADKFVTESFQIRLADAELVSILDGTCTAGLKADVLAGKWDSVRQTDEQQAEAKKQAQLQDLYNQRPFETGNLTQQMAMRRLNPELASQQEEAALKLTEVGYKHEVENHIYYKIEDQVGDIDIIGEIYNNDGVYDEETGEIYDHH